MLRALPPSPFEHRILSCGHAFCDLLEESYNENPRYQREGGDWVNWTVPGTDLSIPIFASGWGDGVYPCYFGFDSDGNVCGVYILFINIEGESEE